ncbi:MAG: C39 family peptidase [Candidatus Sumerlaeota bacterium]|nr:C39 family peptidase [Candidatus Sumerlaeota bacterium]
MSRFQTWTPAFAAMLLFCPGLARCGKTDTQPTSAAQSAPSKGPILIANVPHIKQSPDFCGEACIAMWLQKSGLPVSQDDVFAASSLNPALGRGMFTREMGPALRHYGIEPGAVWYPIPAAQAYGATDVQWKEMLKDLCKGIPSIVCMRFDEGIAASEHFRLILGYDALDDEVIYHEPAEENGAYRHMKRWTFYKIWPLKYKQDEWLLVRMRLTAPSGPNSTSLASTTSTASTATAADTATSSPHRFTPAQIAQHVRDLKPRIPKGFNLVVQAPFVVIGDESPQAVKDHAMYTVKWFVDQMRNLYFEDDPPAIYDVWLMKDKESYYKISQDIFQEEPTTPFGYCSDANHALVMNIGTGGGTLCHEIVHAFIASNFPECPAWFNEGMGSLYEQGAERNGVATGLPNWRLPSLQGHISRGFLPSFKTLCTTTRDEFYKREKNKGDNYAQARYLCLFLQEKGWLNKYYHEFHKNVKTDPSGYDTLQKILGEKDMDAWQKQWEKWVMKLHYP